MAFGESLQVNKTLRGLNLSYCGITDEGVEALIVGLKKNIMHSGIRYIDLDGNSASDAKIEELKRLIRVSLVTYGGNKIENLQGSILRPESGLQKKKTDYLRYEACQIQTLSIN